MGYSTWKSVGEKRLGNTMNYVVSRRKRNLPRGIRQLTDPFSSKYQSDSNTHSIIGGSTLISSIPLKDIKEICIFQIKKDLMKEAEKVEE